MQYIFLHRQSVLQLYVEYIFLHITEKNVNERSGRYGTITKFDANRQMHSEYDAKMTVKDLHLSRIFLVRNLEQGLRKILHLRILLNLLEIIVI